MAAGWLRTPYIQAGAGGDAKCCTSACHPLIPLVWCVDVAVSAHQVVPEYYIPGAAQLRPILAVVCTIVMLHILLTGYSCFM